MTSRPVFLDLFVFFTGRNAAASFWLCNNHICSWKRMGLVWYPPHNYLLFFGAYLLAGTYRLSIFCPWSSWDRFISIDYERRLVSEHEEI
ncbi:hypothetical protein SLA2020_062470 [Shorea laevis]